MDSQAAYLPLLISALAFLISFISFIYFKSYLKKRTSQKRILDEFQEEVDSILKSINDTTERNISLVEDSEKKLKDLMQEIEKRLGVYVRQMERSGKTSTLKTHITEATPHEPAKAAEIHGTTDKPAAEKYYELGKSRYRLSKPSQVQATESAHVPLAPQTSEPAFPIPNFNIKAEDARSAPLAEQVRSLLRSGFSSAIVAGRLGISIAEVELAAALLERRGSADYTD